MNVGDFDIKIKDLIWNEILVVSNRICHNLDMAINNGTKVLRHSY